jgi:hypothetical protein
MVGGYTTGCENKAVGSFDDAEWPCGLRSPLLEHLEHLDYPMASENALYSLDCKQAFSKQLWLFSPKDSLYFLLIDYDHQITQS